MLNPHGQFDVHWIDLGREPQSKPNPAYPQGIDLDLSRGQSPNCKVVLPYPAKRCGQYLVNCRLCGIEVICTTAGRVDDPRSIRIGCKSM